MDILLLIFTFILMLIGLVGIIIPLMPDTVLIFIGALIYGILTKFSEITPRLLLILAGLTVLSYFLDYLGAYLGAKKFGASKWGSFGGIIGGLIGFLTFSFLGLFVLAVAGTIIFELLFAGKDLKKALKGGLGTFLGLVLGIFGKILIALLMIGLFISYLF